LIQSEVLRALAGECHWVLARIIFIPYPLAQPPMILLPE